MSETSPACHDDPLNTFLEGLSVHAVLKSVEPQLVVLKSLLEVGPSR